MDRKYILEKRECKTKSFLREKDYLFIMVMQKLLAFRPQNMPEILKAFQIKLNKKGELVSKNVVKCAFCGKKLKKENVGSILPSSPYNFYCDNPACIAEYVRKTKFED